MNGESLTLSERLSRRLNHKDVEDVCKIFLAMCLVGLVVAFVTAAKNHGQTVFGEALGADFPAFYVAGTIINNYGEYGTAALYDRALQARLYHQFFPLTEADAILPYVNAPFFVLPFPLLARLPYAWAYACWLLISLALYVGGLTLLWRELKGMPAAAYRTALMVAVTFMPFMMECLMGGQTSAFGFFCLALALTLERRGQFVASGAALALLAYKPTLLLLIGPMLLVTRRWRTLAGMAIGGGGLTLLSCAVVGWSGTLGWVKMLLFFGQSSTSAATGLRTWKYVDLNSFARTLWGEQVVLRWLTVGLAALAFVPQIVRAWWLSPVSEGHEEKLRQTSWAITLAWLPVLNVYVGFYDATLLGLSVVLVTEWFYQQADELPSSYRFALLGLYFAPWLSQKLAQAVGLQLYTIVIMAWGAYVLRLVAAARVVEWQAGFAEAENPLARGAGAVASTNP